MKKLSFSEYHNSKKILLSESLVPIEFTTVHTLQKYCKVPFLVEDEKVQLGFKPRDIIKITWQRLGESLTPLSIRKNDVEYKPTWNSKKMKSWVETNAIQV